MGFSTHTSTQHSSVSCCTFILLQNDVKVPCSIGVNWKSGRYFRSLALLAVFLNWPSDFVVSYCPSEGNIGAIIMKDYCMKTRYILQLEIFWLPGRQAEIVKWKTKGYNYFSGEIHGFHDVLSGFLDRDLVLFTNWNRTLATCTCTCTR